MAARVGLASGSLEELAGWAGAVPGVDVAETEAGVAELATPGPGAGEGNAVGSGGETCVQAAISPTRTRQATLIRLWNTLFRSTR